MDHFCEMPHGAVTQSWVLGVHFLETEGGELIISGKQLLVFVANNKALGKFENFAKFITVILNELVNI